MILSPVIFELGIIIVLLSGVLSLVVKILISSTVPVAPAPSIKSLILIGLNIIINIPAAKFESEP